MGNPTEVSAHDVSTTESDSVSNGKVGIKSAHSYDVNVVESAGWTRP